MWSQPCVGDVQGCCSVQWGLMGCSHAAVSEVMCFVLLGEQHYSMEGSLHTGLHGADMSPDGQNEGLKNSFSQGEPTQHLPPL